MRWLAEGFPRGFALTASAMLGCDLRARLTAVTASPLDIFTSTIEDASCCYRMGFEGGGELCIELPRAVAYGMVQALLGGGGCEDDTVNRKLTAVERRILRRVADLAAAALMSVWPGPSRPSLAACDDTTAPSGEFGHASVATFELALGERAGMMRVCVTGPAAAAMAPPPGRSRATAAPLELSATIEDVAVDAVDAALLAEGDLLVTDTGLAGEVTVRIGGIPKFAASLCDSGGKRALRLTRRLGAPKAR
jgi:flagellar motor switch protein FliM